MPKQIDVRLSLDELNLVLVALGQLPYAQVHELIVHLQAEIVPQLVPEQPADESPGSRAASIG